VGFFFLNYLNLIFAKSALQNITFFFPAENEIKRKLVFYYTFVICWLTDWLMSDWLTNLVAGYLADWLIVWLAS
jgi:hypothetical protein